MLFAPEQFVLAGQFLRRADDGLPQLDERLVEIVDDKASGQIVGGGGERDGSGTGKRFDQHFHLFREAAQNRGSEIPLAALIGKRLWHFHQCLFTGKSVVWPD